MNLLGIASRVATTISPYPTVTLVNEKTTKDGKIYQTWKIDATGKSVTLKSMTTGGPDAPQITGPETAINVEDKQLVSTDIIDFILTAELHPRYIPTKGNSVVMDSVFADAVAELYGTSR